MCMSFAPDELLSATELELETALRQKAELDRKIAGLRQVIHGLRHMQGAEVPADIEPQGLTASCRAVLRLSLEPLSAAAVKEQLDMSGFDWSNYTSPISAIHTVLKRLVKRGQAVATEAGGRTRYRWRQVRVVAASKEDIEDPARLEALLQNIK